MYKLKCNIEEIKRAAEIAGGLRELAIKSGASYQSMLNWSKGRNNPNPMFCIKMEQAVDGKVTRKDIFPDFPWEKFKEEK
jgi:DNA-binding transcriptional regulator YdaS (Cro superfamily)